MHGHRAGLARFPTLDGLVSHACWMIAMCWGQNCPFFILSYKLYAKLVAHCGESIIVVLPQTATNTPQINHKEQGMSRQAEQCVGDVICILGICCSNTMPTIRS